MRKLYSTKESTSLRSSECHKIKYDLLSSIMKKGPGYIQFSKLPAYKHSLFAVCADEASPPCLKYSILMCGRALVVGLAPDEVPDGRDNDNGGENNGGIVHRGRGNREVGRHAEEGSRKGRPGCHNC